MTTNNSRHEPETLKILDFIPRDNAGGLKQTTLLPCLQYEVLIPCRRGGGLNPFERVILQLARIGICDTDIVTDTLGMKPDQRDLVHFIQQAMVQKGLLQEFSLAAAETAQDGTGQQEKNDMLVAKVLVEQATGKLIPVILDGNSPVYKGRRNNKSWTSYIKDNTETFCFPLKPCLESEAPPPAAVDLVLAYRRMQRDNARTFLPDPSIFFRGIPDNPGSMSWTPHGPATPCYLACNPRYNTEQEKVWVPDCFGRANNGVSLMLTGIILKCYPQIEEKLIRRAASANQTREEEKLHIPGFRDSLLKEQPRLARALQRLNHDGPSDAAYDVIEHTLSSIARLHADPGLDRLVSGNAADNAVAISESAARLGLYVPEPCPLFEFTPASIGYFLEPHASDKMTPALPLCILEAGLDLKHPMHRWAAAHPQFIRQVMAMGRRRNKLKHETSGRETANTARAQQDAGLAYELARHFMPQYLTTEQQGSARNTARRVNALNMMQERFSQSARNYLRNRRPDYYNTIIQAFLYENDGDFDRATTETAKLFQTILADACLEMRRAGTAPPTPDKTSLTAMCRQAGQLEQGEELPESLATVRHDMLLRAIKPESGTLGANTLAYIAYAATPPPSALSTGRLPHTFLHDMANLCRLRGHGNVNTLMSKEQYNHDVLPLLSESYLTSIVHLYN